MCCIELFFNKCLWMKNCHITREGSQKMENIYDICHKVSPFVSNYTVCLEKGHLPFSEWWTWLLNLRQGTAPSPAWRSANTTRWAQNLPQGNNFGRHVVRRRTQSGRGKGETEGIGGQGQGALGHSGQQEGTALSSNVDLSIWWIEVNCQFWSTNNTVHLQGVFFNWFRPEKFQACLYKT